MLLQKGKGGESRCHKIVTKVTRMKPKEKLRKTLKKKILLYDFFKIKEEQNANNNTKAINSMLGRFGYDILCK